MNNIKRINKIIILSTIFILIFSLNISAQKNLTADRLVFERDSEGSTIVEAKGNAKLIYDDINITGDNAVYNQKNETIIFEGNVVMSMGERKLSGDKMTYNMSVDYIEVSGNVLLEDEGLKITSGILNYDRIGKRLIFTENPYINYDSISARADTIEVSEEENKAVLKGNVTGKQNSNEFKAEQIEILNNGDKIEMVGRAQLIFEQGE